ncbi:MAG TPA: endo-1,4-beta-xylanase [Bacteroidales bacterium]|jgi:GH35 family endo-1,4-beta-xylanase|nr:endo-1,4-beta-xylanase [Bacteroidales bacterium]
MKKLASLCILIILSIHFAIARYPGINDSIAKYRKGTITVHAKKGQAVKIEQLRHEFWFGCAIPDNFAGSMPGNDKKQFEQKFLENFNSAVTENALKWYSMERQKGQVRYDIIDGILKWTESHEIPLRGHNLFWGISQFVQPWIKELGNEELSQTIKNRAETVTSKYRGRFAEYDLNNEMIHGNYYEERLGPGITRQMADWAHNGDPDAKLFVNDYDILTGRRLDDYMAHIRKLKSQGVPVAGIGVQGHLHAETFDRGELRRALDSLAKFHLPVRITEFNMPGQRSSYYKDRIQELTPEQEQQKAAELADYYRICFSHPAVEGILMWGFWAGANWIPASSLYKRDWSPTPALKAYRDLVFGEWWTNANGKTDKKGNFSAPAYYGKYRITVNNIAREVFLSKEKGSLTVDFSN